MQHSQLSDNSMRAKCGAGCVTLIGHRVPSTDASADTPRLAPHPRPTRRCPPTPSRGAVKLIQMCSVNVVYSFLLSSLHTPCTNSIQYRNNGRWDEYKLRTDQRVPYSQFELSPNVEPYHLLSTTMARRLYLGSALFPCHVRPAHFVLIPLHPRIAP